MCAGNEVSESSDKEELTAADIAADTAWMVGFADGCFVCGGLLVGGVIAWALFSWWL